MNGKCIIENEVFMKLHRHLRASWRSILHVTRHTVKERDIQRHAHVYALIAMPRTRSHVSFTASLQQKNGACGRVFTQFWFFFLQIIRHVD